MHAQSGGRVFASPLAKKMAKESNLPLELMTGTGGNNRVTKADVLAFKKAVESAPKTVAAAAPGAVTPSAHTHTHTHTHTQCVYALLYASVGGCVKCATFARFG
jgi:pyruvate/2-oxoglutarate dehydrogenase complex dihydrolipoamide acyltransferase (E2) component